MKTNLFFRIFGQCSMISQYQWGGFSHEEGGFHIWLKKIDFRNPGEGFILKIFKWENPREEN